jgi:hypothetical protein
MNNINIFTGKNGTYHSVNAIPTKPAFALKRVKGGLVQSRS